MEAQTELKGNGGIMEAEVIQEKYELLKIDPVANIVRALVVKYADVVYDVSSFKGMEVARKARAELRGARGKLEEARKEEKADVLARGRYIDATAKKILEEITKYEEPLDVLIKTEEERKETEKRLKADAESKRISDIQEVIESIRNKQFEAVGKSSAEIMDMIDTYKIMEIDTEIFQEFVTIATTAKENAIGALEILYEDTASREKEQVRLNAEREELERRRKEQEEKERRRAAKAKAEREDEEARLAGERAKIEAEKKAEEKRIAEERTKLEAERREQDRQAEESRKAEQRRVVEERRRVENIWGKINAYKEIPLTMKLHEPSEKIVYVLDQMKAIMLNFDKIREDYAEFKDEAQKVLADVISDLTKMYENKLAYEQEQATLKAEQEAHEAKIRAEQEEADRKRLEQEAIEAENERMRLENERVAREQAERDRLALERRKRLLEAKRDNSTQALIEILRLAEDFEGHPNHKAVRIGISILCEANLDEPKEIALPKRTKVRRKAA